MKWVLRFRVLLFCLFFFGISSNSINAAALGNLSDTISTSRPSASSPITANQAASATQVTVVDNGSIFLASDTATLRADTGETANSVNIASMSGVSSGTRVVYFTGTAANSHHLGDALTAPATAMHSIQFNTVTAVPINGRITIAFPTLATNDANTPSSASASTFQLNNLSAVKVLSAGTDITANLTIASSNPTAGTSPTVTLTLDSGTSIAAGAAVKIFLGCSALSGSNCSTQLPTIINPTKTATAGTGDSWIIDITTRDVTGGSDLDTAKTKISTVDSVRIEGSVDSTFSFSIAGVVNNVAVNTGNATGCTITTSEKTSSGFDSSATSVNLGAIPNTPGTTNSRILDIAAQLLTISTNASNGYVLTATSSGQLANPAVGYTIASNTTPVAFPNGTHFFGFHPCGVDVPIATWVSGADQNCNSYITGSTGNLCKYGWPTTTSSITLASKSSGPVTGSAATGNGVVTVEYGAGIDTSVPPGTYQTTVTYIATPIF